GVGLRYGRFECIVRMREQVGAAAMQRVAEQDFRFAARINAGKLGRAPALPLGEGAWCWIGRRFGHHARMVAKPSSVEVSASQPRPFGALLEDSFKLAFASFKPLFWLCFWFNLVAQLPMLWWWWRTRAVFEGSD